MFILGISALYHDSAAAIIKDGEIIAAAQEERFTRKKHDLSVPVNAINYCLKEADITAAQLEAVVFYDNPILTMDRFLDNLAFVAKTDDTADLMNFSYDSIFGTKLWIHKELEQVLGGFGKTGKLLVAEHHISHAASAFYPSPFEDAAVITMDGVGEWATTTIGYGNQEELKILRQINYPHSIGLLYSAFTYFCGFKVNSGDYKLMGLAPYGKPIYYDLIKEKLIDIKPDGSYRLNLEYFDYQYGRAMTNGKFAELFGGERRYPESNITKREMDMAASVQKVVEEVLILTAKTAKEITKSKNLVLAGGVALNCVANGKLLKENIFEHIWVQPAAGDAGGALGGALYAYHQYFGKKRMIGVSDSQKGSYLGPEFSDEEIIEYLSQNHYPYEKFESAEEFYQKVSSLIQNEKVIGLCQGRMEYGPRALGNRSIIGDAKSASMQSQINLKIKYRESFRPFAPSVLRETVSEYFELDGESPYMLLCADVQENIRKEFSLDSLLNASNMDMLPVVNQARSEIPAVTHVDYSARIQTVDEERNPEYYKILKQLQKDTGCSVIINTSFNVRGEPIVCTPEDAYKCFMRTGMDVLVLNHMILYKEQQPEFLEQGDWRDTYELD